MNTSSLRDLFTAITAKYLSSVDADPAISHGHEIGGLSELRSCWGDTADRKEISARFIYLDTDDKDTIEARGSISWYDARRGQIHRGPEWRAYYKDNDVTQAMQAGDFFLLAQMKNGEALCLVAPGGSSGEQRIRALFGIKELGARGIVRYADSIDAISLDFQSRYILDSLGIDYEYDDQNLLEDMERKFGQQFPSTREFSEYARQYAIKHLGVDGHESDPDATLICWYESEDLLFRTFERKIIESKLKEGFPTSDSFIDFSKSVMNRRSARAGMALENHVEAIFKVRRIRYSRCAITENRNKPDFILPGIENYKDPAYPSELLTMLAAKSSCKDRWRQALAEADRITGIKHLLTLEPSISENQTSEMKARNLQLVVPRKIQASYTPAQRGWLWTFERFCLEATENQAKK